MARSLTNAYWIHVGEIRERERIIAIVKQREEDMPHRDYSPQDVIDLVNGKLNG